MVERQRRPLLLSLSDCEERDNTPGAKVLYDKLGQRKEFLVIHDSNHNFGFDRTTGNDLIDSRPAGVLAASMDTWLKKQLQTGISN
jgi:hypothetical protein